MAYSSTTDLLTGNIPPFVDGADEKYVNDAADEIDSAIGHIYQTPIDVTDVPENPVTRPARLLLKRISNWLASGRLMMAAAAGSQQQEVHQYALKLVNDATEALNAIASGDVPLAGAPRIGEVGEESFTGPQIYNEDEESAVEAFYNRIANPRYNFVYPLLGSGEGLVR